MRTWNAIDHISVRPQAIAQEVDTRNLPPRKVEPGKRHLSKEREDAFRLPVLSKADLFVDNLISSIVGSHRRLHEHQWSFDPLKYF